MATIQFENSEKRANTPQIRIARDLVVTNQSNRRVRILQKIRIWEKKPNKAALSN